MKVYTHWVVWDLVVITKCCEGLSILVVLVFHGFVNEGVKYYEKGEKDKSADRDILHGKVVG